MLAGGSLRCVAGALQQSVEKCTSRFSTSQVIEEKEGALKGGVVADVVGMCSLADCPHTLFRYRRSFFLFVKPSALLCLVSFPSFSVFEVLNLPFMFG